MTDDTSGARAQAGSSTAGDGRADASPDAEHGTEGERDSRGGATRTVGAALGEMAWLLSQSAAHRHALFLADLEWLAMPPLTLGQYRLFYADGKPIGVALWAFVADAVSQRLAGGGRPASNEWRGGDRVWLVELIAPFGQQDTMLENLRNTALADRRFRFLRTQPNGRRETVELSGVNVE